MGCTICGDERSGCPCGERKGKYYCYGRPRGNGNISAWAFERESIAGYGVYRRLAESIQPDDPALIVIEASTIKPARVRWLWQSRIPLGKITMLAGDPKLGKSLLSLDIVARVSTGTLWPDSPGVPRAPGKVLLFTAEDDIADTIVPRLMKAGADLPNIRLIAGVCEPQSESERSFSLVADLPRIARVLSEAPDVQLVVLDPVSAFLGKTDSHVNAEVRGVLAPLAALAARHGVAIVALTHLAKPAGNVKALHRVIGSIAFAAVARAVWLVAKDADAPDRRLLLNVGMNLAMDPGGLAYQIRAAPDDPDVPVVAWELGRVDTTADEAIAAEQQQTDRKAELAEAVEWVREKLAGGPVASKEVSEHATEEGIGTRALKAARQQLGVKATPIRDKKRVVSWELSLPVTAARYVPE